MRSLEDIEILGFLRSKLCLRSNIFLRSLIQKFQNCKIAKLPKLCACTIMNYPSLFLANDSIQKVFSSKMSHKQDINLTTSEFKCDLCDYNTTKKELMRQHTVVKHSEVTNKCPDCAFSHYFPGKVRKHFQYVHLKEQPRPRRTDGRRDCFEIDCKNTQKDVCEGMGHNKAVCKQCDYSSLTTDALRRHVQAKHEGKLYSCNQCDFKFARTDQVLIHTARIHDGVLFRCGRCDLVFLSKSALKSHNSFYHTEKIFGCGRCDYKCSNNSTLRKHERRPHQIEENVDCYVEQCNQNGSKEGCRKLDHHKLICQICKYIASTKRVMEKHRRTHNYRHHCEYCSFDTDRKSSLLKHVSAKHSKISETENFDNYDSYEEDDFVKDEQIQNVEVKEQTCELLQQNEAEEPIENMKCKDCNYSSPNEYISKLHFLSHIYSETEIIQKFPPTLRNLTFATEEEFSRNLDVLLKSLSQKGKEENLKEDNSNLGKGV